MKQKHPSCPINNYEEKNILKKLKQNRGAVSLQHNRGTSKNNTKILKQNEGPVPLLHNERASKILAPNSGLLGVPCPNT